ncbi:MAG: hypothetical protein AAF567_24575 [Actinomycetota bacterium]
MTNWTRWLMDQLPKYRLRQPAASGEPMIIYSGNPFRDEHNDDGNTSFFGHDVVGSAAVRVNMVCRGWSALEENLWRVKVSGLFGVNYRSLSEITFGVYHYPGNLNEPHAATFLVNANDAGSITATGADYAGDGSTVLWWEQPTNYFCPNAVTVEATPGIIDGAGIAVVPTVEWHATAVGTDFT